MFQADLDNIDAVLAALASVTWPLYETPPEAWYRVDDFETGRRPFFVRDPDGNLAMLAQNIGHRTLRDGS